MSNIEDDIKILTEENSSYKKEQAIQNILSERKQDKARIKELENRLRDINTYILINGIDEPLKTATQIKVENQQQYIIQEKINLLKKKLENSIPKQKVKDKIEELENAKRETTRENWHYIYSIQLKILQELLEEGE